MTRWKRTYRVVDGERIEGTWRPIFIFNYNTYFLSELEIYADGAVGCGDLVTLDGLAEMIRSGWVATEIPEGARAWARDLAHWTFAEPEMRVTPEGLLGEVADEIDRLAGRPDSSDRCRNAIAELLAHPDEEHRAALKDAFEAIPEHLRHPSLANIDANVKWVRVLMTPVGGELDGWTVTEDHHQQAREHLEGTITFNPTYRRLQADRVAAESGQGPTTTVASFVHGLGWPDPFGLEALRIDYPRPITHGGDTYPSVQHAFWALSVADRRRRSEIVALDSPYQAREMARKAPRVPGWPGVQVAVMLVLLRAKFAQHPDLAELLVSTGDGRIHYYQADEPFWGTGEAEGRNWLGRLLELVRAELAAQRLTGWDG